MKTYERDPERYGERITAVERYICQHMDERLNREVLAAVAGFSVPHFHRLFTAYLAACRRERFPDERPAICGEQLGTTPVYAGASAHNMVSPTSC